jgi:hypothetical protein
MLSPISDIFGSLSYDENDKTYLDFRKNSTDLSRRSEHNSSNLALVMVVSMCLGPSAVAVMNGKLEKDKILTN